MEIRTNKNRMENAPVSLPFLPGARAIEAPSCMMCIDPIILDLKMKGRGRTEDDAIVAAAEAYQGKDGVRARHPLPVSFRSHVASPGK